MSFDFSVSALRVRIVTVLSVTFRGTGPYEGGVWVIFCPKTLSPIPNDAHRNSLGQSELTDLKASALQLSNARISSHIDGVVGSGCVPEMTGHLNSYRDLQSTYLHICIAHLTSHSLTPMRTEFIPGLSNLYNGGGNDTILERSSL
ncbi:hypothetical protein DFH28DRAFT_1220090 [Melampsora americana]|nr:hypothetical protein DFH28DRAFT_1220090 [Melampsora americana]